VSPVSKHQKSKTSTFYNWIRFEIYSKCPIPLSPSRNRDHSSIAPDRVASRRLDSEISSLSSNVRNLPLRVRDKTIKRGSTDWVAGLAIRDCEYLGTTYSQSRGLWLDFEEIVLVECVESP